MLGAVYFIALSAAQPEYNPWRLTRSQAEVSSIIVEKSVAAGLDPFHMLTIGWVESNFKNGKVSRTGDYGVMQVNCRFWYKALGLRSIRACARRMMDVSHNVDAAILVVTTHNNYRHCRGRGVFKCYNGGPKWYRSKNKAKILRYDRRSRDVLRRLTRSYKNWILDLAETDVEEREIDLGVVPCNPIRSFFGPVFPVFHERRHTEDTELTAPGS